FDCNLLVRIFRYKHFRYFTIIHGFYRLFGSDNCPRLELCQFFVRHQNSSMTKCSLSGNTLSSLPSSFLIVKKKSVGTRLTTYKLRPCNTGGSMLPRKVAVLIEHPKPSAEIKETQ